MVHRFYQTDRSREYTRAPFGVVRIALIACFLLITGAAVAFSLEMNSYQRIPSTEAVRRAKSDEMFSPIGSVWDQKREVVQLPGRDPVLFRTNQQNGNRYYVFIPAGEESLDLVSPGTFIVRRRIEDGEVDQIKVFLRRDEGTFIRLFPRGHVVEMDVYVADRPIYRGIRVSLSMQRAVTAPLSMIVNRSAGIVDWSILDVDRSDPGYTAIQTMVSRIREYLPMLPDAEDGAMNEAGELVFIETLASQESLPGFNCSGFAKWVVDGIYHEQTGRYLSIDPLRRKHLDYRGTSWSAPLEDERDPYFGLDWTRNLALEMDALSRGVDVALLNPESMDVRDVPYGHYVEDVGFRVSSLRPILYWLARNEPGAFYLGSVNRLFGTAPVLRQHTHVVALFPYFDEMGRFEVAVMERNVETSVASLEGRYEDDFIHLVRVQATADFIPPAVIITALD